MGVGRGGALGPSTKLVASGRQESLGDPEVSLREMEMEKPGGNLSPRDDCWETGPGPGTCGVQDFSQTVSERP